MPNIYVRLPHYVASFLRNRDENNPIAEGQPFRLETGDPAYFELVSSVIPNLGNRVNIKCFSERQWEAMRQGKMLSYRDGFALDVHRDHREPLAMHEIYRSCNREDLVRYETLPSGGKEPLPDTAYVEMYVPFRLPLVVTLNGREQRVRSDWYLPDANRFIEALTRQFKTELYRFVSIDREYVRRVTMNGEKYRRSKNESIERFMLRYDIRPGEHEREQLKKQLSSRNAATRFYAIDSDENHTRWSLETVTPSPTERAALRRCRPIFVHETGETFPSLMSFAQRIGTTRQCVCTALRNHHRCHGYTIEYADVEPKE